jgi:hypothetical protein
VVTDLRASLFAAWVDYDDDNNLDLFVSNGHGLEGGVGAESNFLYRNDGPPAFTFTKITSGAIVSDENESQTPAWGDYDNDGDLDLFIANEGSQDGSFLYKNNNDGTYTLITSVLKAISGLGGASWVDYDNDGYLDLYGASRGGPNQLFRNVQDDQFMRVESAVNLTGPSFTST